MLSFNKWYLSENHNCSCKICVVVFWQSPLGAYNIWELLYVSLGMDSYCLSKAYNKGILHSKHITQFKAVCIYQHTFGQHYYLEQNLCGVCTVKFCALSLNNIHYCFIVYRDRCKNWPFASAQSEKLYLLVQNILTIHQNPCQSSIS